MSCSQEVFEVGGGLCALTVAFKDVASMGSHLEGVATMYEGKTNTVRQGINFPREVFEKFWKQLPAKERTAVHKQLNETLSANRAIKYVIAYRAGDVATRKHELQHAKYFLDPAYRARVDVLWKQLTAEQQKTITAFLTRLGYPEHVHVDEFQAYYSTEAKPETFFGCRLNTGPLT